MEEVTARRDTQIWVNRCTRCPSRAAESSVQESVFLPRKQTAEGIKREIQPPIVAESLPLFRSEAEKKTGIFSLRQTFVSSALELKQKGPSLI